MKKAVFTDEQVKKILEMYSNGMARYDIANHFGFATDKPIVKVLKSNDVKIKSRHSTSDEHIFDIIDSEAKAYWLGFINGDGYVNEEKNFLKLKLGGIDKEHLIKFCNFIRLNPNEAIKDEIHSVTGNITNYVYVSSKIFIKRLVELGIYQKKSGYEKVVIVPKKYVRDYIRGLFDADGCIASARIDLSGSQMHCEYIQQVFLKELCIEPNTIFDHMNTKRTYFCSKLARYKIFDFLYYSDDITFLDRKYKLAQEFIAVYSQLHEKTIDY